MKLEVNGTDEALRYFEEIASILVLLFPISMDEAIGRINRSVAGRSFHGKEELLMLFHEEPDVWAKNIYYGRESHWWLGEDGLDPLPYSG